MLKNYKLLVDKDCPMCNIYSNAFHKMGLLHKDCITSFQIESATNNLDIDYQRAKDEIAFHNTISGKTTYGLKALILIITQGTGLAFRLMQNKLIYNPLLALYKLISYNRKVIYPTSAKESSMVCNPSFNINYRWTYIIIVAILTGLIVNQFTDILFTHLGWRHNLIVEMVICFGQIAWQSVAIGLLRKEKRLEYLGNMSTVSMIGALLMIPFLVIFEYWQPSLTMTLLIFFSIIGTMFLEHIRRCKLLEIPLSMTASWVAYRTVALALLILIMAYL